MTKPKGRTAQASVPIALAMIASRLESSAAIVRQAEANAKGVVMPTNLATAATAIEDDARALRAVAERASDAKPVTLTYQVFTGMRGEPRIEDRTVAIRLVDGIHPAPEGSPAWVNENARSFIYHKDGAIITSTTPHATLVNRIEGRPERAE
jgi:hypothetical protein